MASVLRLARSAVACREPCLIHPASSILRGDAHISSARLGSRARQGTRGAARYRMTVAASAGPPSYQLPVFPLGTCALPGVKVPLNIFEARYRVLFSTLLAGDSSIDAGLVQADSPFRDNRMFGMCHVSDEGAMCAVGTTLLIDSHHSMKNGQMLVLSMGVTRFKVTRVVTERPVLVCEVVDFPDLDEDDPALTVLADEVRDLFRSNLRLNFKMQSKEAPKEPTELATYDPRALSFWLACMFENTAEQQIMLEMPTCGERLRKYSSILRESLSYLSAASAVQSALTKDKEMGGPKDDKAAAPPSGGPD